METEYFVGFCVVSSLLFVFQSLVAFFAWTRFRSLEAVWVRLNAVVAEKAVPKQLEKAIVVAEASRDRIDTALLEMGKFKEGVHAEIQRFYAIMRRNEKALNDVQLTRHEDGKPQQEFPDEMPATSAATREEDETQISKAELRKRARAAGL